MAEELTREQNALIEKNMDLAHFLAQIAWNKNRNELDLEEVVSVAYQGLIKAAQTFDSSKMSEETVANGKAFAGYARLKISGTIMDWQRESDHVQHRWRTIYKQLQQVGYRREIKSAVQLQALADKISVPLEKVLTVIHAVEAAPVSLNEDHSKDHDSMEGSLGGMMIGVGTDKQVAPSLESSIMETQIVGAVQSAYSVLPEIQKVIIAMRWYQNQEFQTIAASLNISLNAVRDFHSEALMTLHKGMVHAASEHH